MYKNESKNKNGIRIFQLFLCISEPLEYFEHQHIRGVQYKKSLPLSVAT